jgi:signal transduction histidine kinase
LVARWVLVQAGIPSVSLGLLMSLTFHPLEFGFAIQLMVVPIAFIYLFSSRLFFREAVSDGDVPRSTRKLFAGLALIELLAFFYGLGFSYLSGMPLEGGTAVAVSLVVLAAGLLGGWKTGLEIALVAVFLRGTQNLFRNPALPEFQAAGVVEVLFHRPWGYMLLDHYVLAPGAVTILWAGAVSGLCAELLGRRRLAPMAALLLGVGTDLGAGLLNALARSSLPFPFLIPTMLESGLVLAAVAFIVRGVQAEAARREAAAAELARTRAELVALRAQINPHFLFNALNTIRYFVRTDPEAARRLLLHLSEVFQRALRSGEFVPLQDEFSYVKAYLALEKARLGERLQAEWAVQVEDWLDLPVPTLILQPIVENAVVHGVAGKSEGGTVRITADQAGDDLVLRVEDDGPGIEADRLAKISGPPETDGGSIGLRNVDGRLRTLYGEEHRLVIESEVGRGTRVEIRIPIGR